MSLPSDPDERLQRWIERDLRIGDAAERRQLELRLETLEAELTAARTQVVTQAARLDQLSVELAAARAAAGRSDRLLAKMRRAVGRAARGARQLARGGS